MKYTIKSAVIAKYVGDNKVNNEMKIALVHEYDKYKLYLIDDCKQIMDKAMSCRTEKAFIKYAEQLEDILDKLYKYNAQLDKELYDADE